MREEIILLVEDNPNDEALTLRALKKHNIMNRVVVAHGGAEALEYLFRKGAHAQRPADEIPQVVLLDLNLPKVGGHDVLKQIRSQESTKLLPVVILTSSKEEKDLLAGYRGGANSYVVKPVDFAQFSDAVRQLGLYWLLINEKPPQLR
jgi:two-component system response regulator